ncbi:hypothetical protein CIB48_g5670 [Xylaria polymorpha]|nr:hypothetical protein CIB48_g5670 [Xylaria polymorpha]
MSIPDVYHIQYARGAFQFSVKPPISQPSDHDPGTDSEVYRNETYSSFGRKRPTTTTELYILEGGSVPRNHQRGSRVGQSPVPAQIGR